MNLSLAPLTKSLSTFMHRFHVLIFVIVALGGLIAAILVLNSIITRSSANGDGYTAAQNSATFDQATIKRIEDLKTRDQTGGQLDLSQGRTNPFVE